jgi:peptidoglycan/LPS O-acetylase OafA/YrhL
VIAGYALHPSGAALQVYTPHMLLEFGAGMILGRLWVMRKHARRDAGHAVLMALGDASYSIYLAHIFTLGALCGSFGCAWYLTRPWHRRSL